MLTNEWETIAFRNGLNLPPLVERYLKKVLPQESSDVCGVKLVQTGKLKSSMDGRWCDFRAEEEIWTRFPSFIWNAKVSIFPGFSVNVIDRLDEQVGAGELKLFSFIPLKQDVGDDRFFEASLQRYLAEAVWCPEIFLSKSITWTQVSDRAAKASLSWRKIQVELEFTFETDGLVSEAVASERWCSEKGDYVKRPWKGAFRNYRHVDGHLVPLEGTASWLINQQWQDVWKAEMKQVYFLK